MQFFKTIEAILLDCDIASRFKKFDLLYTAYKKDHVVFESTQKQIFTTPTYAAVCNVVDAKEVPKRTALTTKEGKAILLHAIAHIEYSAIDLALDACYRFENMPKAFYDDWLEVAADEIRHFEMIEERLNSLGYAYGDFNVHSFLFDISQRSLTLLERMATVPRYLEASGLDSNPKIIEKLSHHKDPLSQDIIKILQVILEEEVDHVKKGDRWFAYACKEEGVDKSCYFDIVEKILPGAKNKKPYVNVEDRKKAGFSCDEIKVISDQKCE
ncbi:MAG: ferritin-like domain-containing protein [Campylobacterota bacterium]